MSHSSRLLRSALSHYKPPTTISRCRNLASPFRQLTSPRRNLPLNSQVTRHSSFVRFNTSLTVPESEKSSQIKPPAPSYQLTFTCKPCKHRSAHTVSKQGYHHGTVLITCPSCKSRHVISDHLKIFMDEKSTLEDILKRGAEGGDLSKLIKKGRLGMREGQLVGNEGEEDIEFWEDGSETTHSKDP